MFRAHSIALVAILALVWPPAAFSQTVLPNGSLVRASDSPRVYYIENGLKRYIPTAEAFSDQGFNWSHVLTVAPEDLAAYPQGESITRDSDITLPTEIGYLPDLVPLAPRDIYLSTVDGRQVVRFSALFWNKGATAFELIANPTGNETTDETLDTYQRIFHTDGSVRDRWVGNFLWHLLHDHYHYEQFATYALTLVKPYTPGDTAPVVSQKTTFCMRDDVATDLALPNAPQSRVYSACGKYRQGVSVGWTDNYPHTLPDQYLETQDLPAGVYALTFLVDPEERFVETNYENNTSLALLDLNPAAGTVSVLASVSSFSTTANQFPNGFLVQPEGKSEVYVIQNNKKRWVRSEEIFHSYGYSWNDIYILPQSAIDAIPTQQLIRLSGTGSIYALNNAGHKRRILSPDVLSSYGWTGADVVDVNETEFTVYPDSDLIMPEGSTDVFSLTSKTYVGDYTNLFPLGYDPLSVHTINETDLRAYATRVVAQDLNVPWDIAFLPDGDMLVTERPGTLRRLGANPVSITVPNVKETGEGGLMGIALHPDFATNNLIYLYFTSSTDNANRVVRYHLSGSILTENKVILSGIPSAIYHDGGQIAFGPDGMLYIVTGDANNTAHAQDLNSLAGKTLRLTADGDIPSDNPFGTAVWSYGHRNAQGIAWDEHGRMWQTEHGRSGATSGYDELNIVEKGKNYGWPTDQGDAQSAGMTKPILHSGPSVTWAPSGIAYTDGSLFFAGLRGSSLYQAHINDAGEVTSFETLLSGVYGRLRGVVLGSDNVLYITTSNRDGRGTVLPGDDKIIAIYPELYR